MPQSSSPAALAPATVLAKRFRIEQLVGSGGYASVYRATDLTMGYERAIKEVTDTDAQVRRQFQLEAELLINTRHPNIPDGYHLIEDRNRMYLVMEFIHGKDLEELLNESLTQRNRALDEGQVLRWMTDICDALVALHTLQVPIIHRDIKPANIKITPENRPVLIDFGLAKLHRTGHATMTAAQGVSPGFAPPEQYMAKGRTDARTDIYGLGATLYASLTGQDPPDAPTRLLAQTGATMHGGAALVPPRRLNARISEATERIIMKSLALSPNARQQTAREMQGELAAALAALSSASGSGYAVPVGTGARPSVMGIDCPQCGQRNETTANFCSSCSQPLSATAVRQGATPPPTSAKRAAVSNNGAKRGTAQTPAVNGSGIGVAAAAAGAAAALDAPSGKRPATGGRAKKAAVIARPSNDSAFLMDQPSQKVASVKPAPKLAPLAALPEPRTAQRPAVVDDRLSAQHAAVGTPFPSVSGYPTESGMAIAGMYSGNGNHANNGGPSAAAVPPVTRGATAVAPAMRANEAALRPPRPVTPPRGAAGAPAPTKAHDGTWLRFGEVPLSGFGRWMLALFGVEALWGAVVLAVGIITLVTHGKPFPTLQFVVGWGIAALIFSVLGGQALSRPIYRRGRVSAGRRGFQGTVLALYAFVVHAVAIYGAIVFVGAPPAAPLAVIAFLLFGVSVLVAGVLSVANLLG